MPAPLQISLQSTIRSPLSSAQAEIALIQYLDEVFVEDGYRSGMLALEVERLKHALASRSGGHVAADEPRGPGKAAHRAYGRMPEARRSGHPVVSSVVAMPGVQKVVPGMSKQLFTVLVATAAVILVAAQSLGSFSHGSLTLISPWSFVLIIPTLLGAPPWLVPFLWGALFVGWCHTSMWGAVEVPSRTVALWLATAILSIAYFVTNWRAGVMFQGLLFTVPVLVGNVVTFCTGSTLLWRALNKPSFGRCLRLHMSLFMWISTYAFPYLGSGVIG
jgi:hypothetical protein